VAVAAVVMALLIVLILAGRTFAGIVLVAVVATAWTVYGRPRWTRRYLRASQNRPSWTIGPE